MPKPPTAPRHVLAFIEAVCPDAPALYAASFSEKTCLQDATEIILRYRAALNRIADGEDQDYPGSLMTLRQARNIALEALNPK